jgi:surface antigen
MSPLKALVCVVFAGLALTGCQTKSKQAVGPSGTASSAVIDAMVGSEIGRQLNDGDRRALYDAQYRALEYGKAGSPVVWKNQTSGHYGEVVPGAGYKINASSCRDYNITIYLNGQPKATRGAACRQPDGTWKTVT